MNFGPPDDVKVGIMGHEGSAEKTIASGIAFARQLGLIPIRVRCEIRGYATNRVWRAVKKEALFLIQGGYATPADIDRGWMLDWHRLELLHQRLSPQSHAGGPHS